jgi:hypothetical protein
MDRYQHRPTIVSAYRFDENMGAPGDGPMLPREFEYSMANDTWLMFDPGAKAWNPIKPGDYVVETDTGCRYPMNPERFERNYEELGEWEDVVAAHTDPDPDEDEVVREARSGSEVLADLCAVVEGMDLTATQRVILANATSQTAILLAAVYLGLGRENYMATVPALMPAIVGTVVESGDELDVEGGDEQAQRDALAVVSR